jgi:hypothetical protein
VLGHNGTGKAEKSMKAFENYSTADLFSKE